MAKRGRRVYGDSMTERPGHARKRGKNPLEKGLRSALGADRPITPAEQAVAEAKLRAIVQAEGNERSWGYRGYTCFLIRQRATGVWCGYVELRPGNPLFGKEEEDLAGVRVHGGITGVFQREGGWAIGFDAGHAGDLAPNRIEPWLLTHDMRNYWSAERMVAQANAIVDQIEDEGASLLPEPVAREVDYLDEEDFDGEDSDGDCDGCEDCDV
jgi:hypothetical protein